MYDNVSETWFGRRTDRIWVNSRDDGVGAILASMQDTLVAAPDILLAEESDSVRCYG